jgi:hypothetical protein
MKLSVSLSGEDVEFIDSFAEQHGIDSRSGVLQRAVTVLRATELGSDYAAAWEEWSDAEAADWEGTAGDGLDRPDS